jgi:hypothetical protein
MVLGRGIKWKGWRENSQRVGSGKKRAGRWLMGGGEGVEPFRD